MGYYQGDYYEGDYRAGNPLGFLGAAAGRVIARAAPRIAKGAVQAVKGLIGSAKKAPVTTTVATIGTIQGAREVLRASPQVKITPGGGQVIMQPVPGARGVIQRLLPGGESGYYRRRRMNVLNPKALTRAIRRARGFAKFAKKAMTWPIEKPRKGKPYFKRKRSR